MDKFAWILLVALIIIDIWLVWSAYRPQPQDTTAQPEVVTETISNTTASTTTQTQADCDTAEDPYDCDYERVMAQLGNPTRDERRGEIIEHDTHNTYRNEFWGFQFDYPKEWSFREYAFGATYSLFNLRIGGGVTEESGPSFITFNVSLDRWWQHVLKQAEADDISWTVPRIIAGKTWYDADKLHPSIQIPNKHYILDRGEYWFTIDVKLGFHEPPYYQEEFDMILDSFEFFEVGY